jgi:uncharacterized membrane protein
MARNNADLAISVAIAAGAVVIAFLDPHGTGLSLLYAAPLVLILPGYVITSATFADRHLEFFERLAWSIGISVACAAVTGVVLNALSIDLNTRSWSLALAAIVVGGAIPAWLRRRSFEGLPVEAERLRLRPTYALLLAALITVVAAGVAVAGVALQPQPGFSALWITPVEGSGVEQFTLGIRNAEGEATTYRLQVSNAGAVVAEWQDILIEDGEEWRGSITLPAVPESGDAVTGALYRIDQPDSVYRVVQYWRAPVSDDGGSP